MKTYILMKNDNNNVPETGEDIKVEDIYGIYQNRCKAFWECKVANLSLMKKKSSNNPILLQSYSLKEVDLESSNILNSYIMKDRNYMVDSQSKIQKIPTFYNDVQVNNISLS